MRGEVRRRDDNGGDCISLMICQRKMIRERRKTMMMRITAVAVERGMQRRGRGLIFLNLKLKLIVRKKKMRRKAKMVVFIKTAVGSMTVEVPEDKLRKYMS
nr:uncharacterized protein LOC113728262 [Coffea arabica]